VNVERLRTTALLIGFVVGGCASSIPSPNSAGVVVRPASSKSLPPGNERSLLPSAPNASPGETLPPVVASLAPVPTDCSPTAPPDTMALKNFGGGFSDGGTVYGRVPVWTLGLPNDGVLLPQPVSENDERFPSFKVMWIVGPNETQPVTVSGRERSTGEPLWFQIYPANAGPDVGSTYTTTLRLDPARPNRGQTTNAGGDWSIWGIGVGARAAGCYSMTVASSKGAWTIDLAVGS
jgi:hypothetical protein